MHLKHWAALRELSLVAAARYAQDNSAGQYHAAGKIYWAKDLAFAGTMGSYGIARADAASERDNDRRRIGRGPPLEFVTSPHLHWPGVEPGPSANLNERKPFAMVSAGFRPGRLD